MFPSKAMTAVLEPRFIEARLHIDIKPWQPGYHLRPRIIELRDKYLGVGNAGMPHYLVFDPARLDEPLAHKEGILGGAEAFLEFFRTAEARAANGSAVKAGG